jgi:hypothetical protein
MNIGVLTFPEEINHGAFFQAFALQNFLIDQGFQVELINYKNKGYYIKEYKIWLCTKNPITLYKNIKKILKFRKDQKSLNLSKFTTNKAKTDIEKYDAIIVGSDIVWDYDNDLIGRDPIFFGEGLESKPLIAYAASCCDVNTNNIPQYVKTGIPKFSVITTRDNNTVDLVKNVIGTKPPIVADPTLLYDFTKVALKDINQKKPYILVYAYKLRKSEIESTLIFAKQKNMKIISIAYPNTWCDENHIDVGPFEWLSYFQHAEYVLTSTFHGTIFSIIYKKTFVTSGHKHILNKLSAILETANLNGRIVEGESIMPILENPVDYEKVQALISPLIIKSREYLLNALKDIER